MACTAEGITGNNSEKQPFKLQCRDASRNGSSCTGKYRHDKKSVSSQERPQQNQQVRIGGICPPVQQQNAEGTGMAGVARIGIVPRSQEGEQQAFSRRR